MIGYLFIGVALLLSVLLIARFVAAADPRALAKGVRYGGGAAAAGVALFLVVSGRWPYIMAALGTLLPLAMRWRAQRDRARGASGPRAGRRSAVETAKLRMSLDHDSGEMDGEVRSGAFAGRRLAALSAEELMTLLAECRRDDTPSVALLESYLDRRFGADWREEAEKAEKRRGAGGRGPAMTRQEALEILGLAEGAGPEQIKEAYRRLMMKLHPDAGGSAYLATKLNQAKELLLGD
jgi:hypothetical protein